MDASAADDIFGCGDLVYKPDVGCTPLNALVASTQLPSGWLVDEGTTTERTSVKHTSGSGGVLCCKD